MINYAFNGDSNRNKWKRLSAFLCEHEDPETTLGMEFFAIKMNGFWFLGVVVKSFVLDVAVFSNSSVNRLLCIRFNISKGVSLW